MDDVKLEFRDDLAKLGMTLKEFAAWAGVSYNTARNWGTPLVRRDYDGKRRAVPALALKVIEQECKIRALEQELGYRNKEKPHEISGDRKEL